ncbi:AAA family ATPase [Acidobacteriota bacterium]
MKIAVTGKGGTGKTSFSGVFAHLFHREGYSVLAVDADPDANLASALGFPEEIIRENKPVAEQRKLIKERTGANPKEFGQLFKINPTVDDIPDEFSVKYKGIKLLTLGAVRQGGDGCACPENVLLKNLLSEIFLYRKEVVIVDMEAGIEHLGRATTKAVDLMLIITEPGSRSLETARDIIRMGKELGIRNFGVIGNKFRNREQESWLKEQLPANMLWGFIPYDDKLAMADLEQKSVFDCLTPPLEEIFRTFLRRALTFNPSKT